MDDEPIEVIGRSAIMTKSNANKVGHENAALQVDDEEDLGRTVEVGDGDHLEKRQEDESHAVEVGGEQDDDREETEDELFEDLVFEPNWVTKLLGRLSNVKSTLKSCLHPTLVKRLPFLVGVTLYLIYFFAAVHFYVTNDDDSASFRWCDGFGFLVVLTVIVFAGFTLNICCMPCYTFIRGRIDFLVQHDCGIAIRKRLIGPVRTKLDEHGTLVGAVFVFLAILIFAVIDTADNRERLVSAVGLLAHVIVGFIISRHPGRVVWRHVIWGILLQFVLGLVILRWQVGKDIFQCLGDKVSTFLAYTDDGSSFVYGSLVSQQPFWTFALNDSSVAFQVATEINESKAFAFVFMFKVLSVIYFFSFFISMLFYLGWMQWLVIKIGKLLQLTIGTTACESLNAAANVFLGQTEAPLMIKPYLPMMTNSELHAVMTGGFATIAGSVLAAYISFGISASHLLSASVMSAPAALAMAKLIYPETKKSKTQSGSIPEIVSQEANLLDAASQGAVVAVFLVANIGGTLIAVLAFIGFLNGILAWFGMLVGVQGLTFEFLLGKLFIPLAWVMGVPNQDLEPVGVLIGLKTFVNEFAAYDRLSQFDREGLIGARSRIIATYALCGFSNPASIGIQLAGLGTMAPKRRSDLAKVAFRAFVAGSMACFLTACIAGMLIDA